MSKDDCPVQVTDWVTAEKYLEPWKTFLENKGITTYTESDNFSHRGTKRLYFRLFRSITEKEKQEIVDKKFCIKNGFLQKTSYDKKDNNLRDTTTFECICCGDFFIGHDKGGHNLCAECKRRKDIGENYA